MQLRSSAGSYLQQKTTKFEEKFYQNQNFEHQKIPCRTPETIHLMVHFQIVIFSPHTMITLLHRLHKKMKKINGTIKFRSKFDWNHTISNDFFVSFEILPRCFVGVLLSLVDVCLREPQTLSHSSHPSPDTLNFHQIECV